MNSDFEHIFNDMKRESLTDSERIRMRGTLQALMAEHPIATAPLRVRFLDAIERFTIAPHSVYGRVLVGAFALVLVVGVGTSYAAENALPGDPLYPIKVNVNEAVVGALTISQSAKAQWKAEQIARRLSEAEALAAESKLTPVARAEIETQVNETAHEFDTNVAVLAEAGDVSAIATVQSDLQASLDAHEQVLAKLSDDAAAGTSLGPIISTVRGHAIAIALAQSHLDAAVASSSPAVAQAAARKQKNAASDAVGRVHDTLASKRGKDAEAHSDAAIAASAMKDGDQKLKDGDFGGAFQAFHAAAQIAKTTSVRLDMSDSLGDDASSTDATSTATSSAATEQHDESESR